MEKPFELQTDTSAFVLGIVLFQADKRGKKHMIGAVSRTLTEPKQNYNIWD